MYNKVLKEILSYKNKEKAQILSRFFKTQKGEYGEGDLFLGIVVPESRKLAIKYNEISLENISKLIQNKYHEVRLVALLIIVHKYKKSKKDKEKKELIDLYLSQTKYINNWDLVDLSVHYTLGDYIYNNKNQYKQPFPLEEKAFKFKSFVSDNTPLFHSLYFPPHEIISIDTSFNKNIYQNGYKDY